MMSSSPPPNNSTGYTPYSGNTNQQGINLTSSPSFHEDLNLQLQNVDHTIAQSSTVPQNQNYTTNETMFIHPGSNVSDNSLAYDPDQQQTQNYPYHNQFQHHHHHHQHQHQHQQQHLQQQQSFQISPVLDTYAQKYPSMKSMAKNRSSFASPHYTTVEEHIDEYEDYVPASTNYNDPNLHYPLSLTNSASLVGSNLSQSTTSSSLHSALHSRGQSQSQSQSHSTNSLVSHLHQTPSQPSRRLSATAMYNVSTPSHTPLKKIGVVTPKVMGSLAHQSTHRRSKSRLQIENSPVSGNPFYVPPSFLSPKVSKKTHRKNISITNSISLNQLDADLALLQDMNTINHSGSPYGLKTPGGRYMYETNDDDGDSDHDKDEDGDNDNDFLADKTVDVGATLISKDYGQILNNQLMRDSINNHNDDNDEQTFIVPDLLDKSKHLNELDRPFIQNQHQHQPQNQSQNDPESAPILDAFAGNYSNANYLDDIFNANDPTVESLSSEFILPLNSSTTLKDSVPPYIDTLESTNQQKQKYQYRKSIDDDFISHHLIHQQQQQQQPQRLQYPHALSHHQYRQQQEALRLRQQQQRQQHQEQQQQYMMQHSEHQTYSKSASVPQSRKGSMAQDSKLQRSRSSFNLSHIAASRESSNQLHRSHGRHIQQMSELMEPYNEGVGMSPNQQFIYGSVPQDQESPYDHATNTTSASSVISTSLIPRSTSLQEVAENASMTMTSTTNMSQLHDDDISSYSMPLPKSKTSTRLRSSRSNTRDSNVDDSPTGDQLNNESGSSDETNPQVRTRSKSKRGSITLNDIEKLDLPQQSARSKSRLKKHSNDAKKVHECPLCHMRFQRPEHVKRHMLSHSSEKPFACPEPDCNKRFNRKDNLKQHLRNIHKKAI